MNDDQRTRLEIMQALEKDFPDRVLEDLIDMALYVEVGGIERARLKESADRALESFRSLLVPMPAQNETEPRVFETWSEVPAMTPVCSTAKNVYRKAVGEIQRQTLDGQWWSSILTTDDMHTLGPFTEVLS